MAYDKEFLLERITGRAALYAIFLKLCIDFSGI